MEWRGGGGAAPEAAGVEGGEDAGEDEGDDAQNAVGAAAHHQQHHYRHERPRRATWHEGISSARVTTDQRQDA